MKKTITLISSFVFFFIQINAQQAYKGGGTSNSTFLLGFASYAAKSQCIFLPSDLTNAASGNITTLYYKYGSNGGQDQTLYNFTIQIGQTSDTSFTNGNEFFTGLTQVFNSSDYVIPAGASGIWFPISLSNYFNYDVSQTLIIQLTFDSSEVDSWGTLGTSNTPVKKIFSPDVNAATGSGTSSTWQDMGFDLVPVGVPTITSPSFTFDVSPNPCNVNLSIKIHGLNNHDQVNLSLMNVLGETVFAKSVMISEALNYDVSGWPKGIYLVRAANNDLLVTKKIVIE